MNYQPMQNYGAYQPMPQPYPDRLSQLQNQYQTISNIQPAPQVNQGLLWVSGEVGAKSYLVAPNSTVLLMDSDASRFYLKSADNSGMPNLRIFEYKEVTNTPQNAPQSPNNPNFNFDDKYVTRDEYNSLKSQYESLVEKLENISVNPDNSKTKSRSKGASGNESDI